MKRKLIVLGVSGVLLTVGIVGAQQNQSGGAEAESQATETQTAEATATGAAGVTDAQRSAMLAHMLLDRHLDMGSTLTVTFYDGDPEADGSELSSLEFVYGEDSEAAFAEELETAAQASYVSVTTSPQTETINLTQVAEFGGRRFGEGQGRHGPGGFGGMRGSPEGRSY